MFFLFGTGQGKEQIKVLRRVLRELSRFGETLHNRLAGAALNDLRRIIRDTNVTIRAASNAAIVRSVFGHFDTALSTDSPQQTAVPLVDDPHRNHGSSQPELHRLRGGQLERAAQVQVATVGASRVGENKFTVLEADARVTGRDGAVVQHHVGSRRPPEQQGTTGVAAVRLHDGAEGQLEARIKEALGHFVLGRHQKADIGRFEAALEQFNLTSISELEVTLESALAHTAGGVDAAQEADLVVRFGRVPFSETLDVNVLGITGTFARGNHGILVRVFFIETHVAHGVFAVASFLSGSLRALGIHGIVRVF